MIDEKEIIVKGAEPKISDEQKLYNEFKLRFEGYDHEVYQEFLSMTDDIIRAICFFVNDKSDARQALTKLERAMKISLESIAYAKL